MGTNFHIFNLYLALRLVSRWLAVVSFNLFCEEFRSVGILYLALLRIPEGNCVVFSCKYMAEVDKKLLLH